MHIFKPKMCVLHIFLLAYRHQLRPGGRGATPTHLIWLWRSLIIPLGMECLNIRPFILYVPPSHKLGRGAFYFWRKLVGRVKLFENS